MSDHETERDREWREGKWVREWSEFANEREYGSWEVGAC